MIYFILFFLVIVAVFFIIKLIDSITGKLAPPISTPTDNLVQIEQALQISPGDKVIEIGCGDARVLCYCAKNNPKAIFTGIENGILMFIKAKIKTRHLPNVEIIFKDLTKARFGSATRIYVYLLPTALTIIKPRIPNNCRVVSLEFKFPKLKPTKIISLTKQSSYAHRLYIYKF